MYKINPAKDGEIFPDLTKGLEIEIQVVDHCNLNCGGCNHFSCIAEKHFLPLDEFETNLKALVTLGPTLKRLMFVGGEPLLHPDIDKMISMARDYFPDPNFQIDILTNGIILEKKIDTLIPLCEKTRSTLLWTPYPNQNYQNVEKALSKVEKDPRYEDEDSIPPLSILYSRMFFAQPSINKEPIKDLKRNYLNCHRYAHPTFIIRNSKVFLCPGAACMDVIGKKFNFDINYEPGDYLTLDQLTLDNLITFMENGPTSICRYCNIESESVYWHKYSDSLKSFQEFSSVTKKQMFLYNYDLYQTYYNGAEMFPYFLNAKINSKTFFELTDPVYGVSFTKEEKSKIDGKLDVIIPIYSTTIEQLARLITTLEAQTIKDECHFYIVSDHSFQEPMIFDCFESSNLYHTFLKTSARLGPGGAKRLGTENSFNPYVFYIDCDDMLTDSHALEKLVNNFSDDIDIVCGRTYSYDLQTKRGDLYDIVWEKDYPQDMHGYCYKREFLNKNNIKFKDYFLNEDADMCFQIVASQARVKTLEDFVYIYLRGNPTSFGPNTTWEQKALSFLAVHLNGFIQCKEVNEAESLNCLACIYSMHSLSEQGKHSPQVSKKMTEIFAYACYWLQNTYKDWYEQHNVYQYLAERPGCMPLWNKVNSLREQNFDFTSFKEQSKKSYAISFFRNVKDNLIWMEE